MISMNSAFAFFRKQARKIALSVLVAAALVLALTSPASQTFGMRRQVSNSTLLTAAIRPHRVITINSEFPGRVANLDISSGNEIKSGDRLITLANPEFDMECERAKVHLGTVRRRLGSRILTAQTSDLPQAGNALRAANERLSGFSLDTVQSNYEKARAHMEEVEGLVQQGLATNRELDELRRVAEMALRDVRSEREHLSRLKEEVEIAASRVAYSQRLLRVPVTADEINLRMELQEAETALQIASRRVDSQQIISTEAGTVLKVMVNLGDQIPSGFPLVQIGQLDTLDFDVPTDGLIARSLKVGQTVTVHVPTEPPVQIRALIGAISLVPSQDQSAYLVRITAPNPAPSAILVGLSGEVEFTH